MKSKLQDLRFGFLFKLHGILHTGYELVLKDFNNEHLNLFSSSIAASTLSDEQLMRSGMAIYAALTLKRIKSLEKFGYNIEIAVYEHQPLAKYDITQAWIKKNFRKEVSKSFVPVFDSIHGGEKPLDTLLRAYRGMQSRNKYVFVYTDVFYEARKLLDSFPQMFNFIFFVVKPYNKMHIDAYDGKKPKTINAYTSGYEDWSGHFQYATTLMEELIKES